MHVHSISKLNTKENVHTAAIYDKEKVIVGLTFEIYLVVVVVVVVVVVAGSTYKFCMIIFHSYAFQSRFVR